MDPSYLFVITVVVVFIISYYSLSSLLRIKSLSSLVMSYILAVIFALIISSQIGNFVGSEALLYYRISVSIYILISIIIGIIYITIRVLYDKKPEDKKE